MLPREESQYMHAPSPVHPYERRNAVLPEQLPPASRVVTPTAETQELYDKMRDAELQAKPPQLCPPGGLYLDEEALHQVPEHDPESKSSAMSRQASGQSQASSSDNNGGIKKAKRNGPLACPARAKAAFMRKVGACSHCRRRRVSCPVSHKNFSRFEESYLRRRRRIRQNRQRPRNRIHHLDQLQHQHFQQGLAASSLPLVSGPLVVAPPSASLHPCVPTTSAPPSSLRTQLQQQDGALLGLGIQHLGLPDNARYRPTISDEELHMSGPSASIGISLPDDVETSELLEKMQPSSSSDMFPIGKLLPGGTWECQFGDDTDANFSAASSMNGMESCHQHCAHLSQLCDHYTTAHLPFQECDTPFMYKCPICDAVNKGPDLCLNCWAEGPSMTTLYYGQMSQTHALNLNAIAIPTRRGRTLNAGVFQPSSGTHTSSDFAGSAGNHFPPGNTMGCGGSGWGGYGGNHWGHKCDGEAACEKDGVTTVFRKHVTAGAVLRCWGVWLVVLSVAAGRLLGSDGIAAIAACEMFKYFASTALADWVATYLPATSLLCFITGATVTWTCRHVRQYIGVVGGLYQRDVSVWGNSSPAC